MFFVISGFILPWSLHRANYTIGRYGRFIAKRIVRIDPPYLVTACAILLLNYASSRTPGFAGTQSFPGWAAVLGHIGFLNAFTGQPWLNPVFWTLAIEFQFYLLIGLVFPLTVSRSGITRWCLTVAFLAAPFLYRDGLFLAGQACLFLLGIATFQYRAGLTARPAFFALLAAATADIWYLAGGVTAAAGLLTALAIAFVPGDSRLVNSAPLVWLGTISYSLYLVHVPIGGRVVNLAHRLPQSPLMQCLEALVALGVSLAAAMLLYRLVEKPARALASRIAWQRA